MKLGLVWPYLDQRPAPAETWRMFNFVEPDAVRICGNANRQDLTNIISSRPGIQVVVRAKLPKVKADGTPYWLGEPRPDLLDYREWPSEPTLRETITYALQQGCYVDAELLNEPDLEWDSVGSDWDITGRWQTAAEDFGRYLERQLSAVQGAFGAQYPQFRTVAPALSEGWPARHTIWLRVLEPIFARFDVLAVHAYTNGLEYGDQDWGGRPLYYRERFPTKPQLVTECNDNGHNPLGSDERAQELSGYVTWLTGTAEVETCCMFQLPGQPDAYDWWNLTDKDTWALSGARPPFARRSLSP